MNRILGELKLLCGSPLKDSIHAETGDVRMFVFIFASLLRIVDAKLGCLIFLRAYSFTCASGICENNCRSIIIFSRRSN